MLIQIKTFGFVGKKSVYNRDCCESVRAYAFFAGRLPNTCWKAKEKVLEGLLNNEGIFGMPPNYSESILQYSESILRYSKSITRKGRLLAQPPHFPKGLLKYLMYQLIRYGVVPPTCCRCICRNPLLELCILGGNVYTLQAIIDIR